MAKTGQKIELTKEMFLDFNLGCVEFCKKYGISAPTFYKLHYEALQNITRLETFYMSMCGEKIPFSKIESAIDKDISEKYHEIELQTAKSDEEKLKRYNALESTLLRRRNYKVAVKFNEFTRFYKQVQVKFND